MKASTAVPMQLAAAAAAPVLVRASPATMRPCLSIVSRTKSTDAASCLSSRHLCHQHVSMLVVCSCPSHSHCCMLCSVQHEQPQRCSLLIATLDGCAHPSFFMLLLVPLLYTVGGAGWAASPQPPLVCSSGHQPPSCPPPSCPCFHTLREAASAAAGMQPLDCCPRQLRQPLLQVPVALAPDVSTLSQPTQPVCTHSASHDPLSGQACLSSYGLCCFLLIFQQLTLHV